MDGTIDMIVTDHSPHESGAKLAPFPETERGMSSFDVAMCLLIELEKTQGLSFDLSLNAMTRHPAKLLGLKDSGMIDIGKRADCVLFDPNTETQFDESNWTSAGRNSPWINTRLPGKVASVWVNGETHPAHLL